jgi:hypothetical protein
LERLSELTGGLPAARIGALFGLADCAFEALSLAVATLSIPFLFWPDTAGSAV